MIGERSPFTAHGKNSTAYGKSRYVSKLYYKMLLEYEN